jgi:hypothetical protein
MQSITHFFGQFYESNCIQQQRLIRHIININRDTYCVGFFGSLKNFNIALMLSSSARTHTAVLFVVDYGPSQINSSKYFQLNRQHHRETVRSYDFIAKLLLNKVFIQKI